MANAPTSLTHWGAFTAEVDAGDIASVTPLDRRHRSVSPAGQPARFDPAPLADHRRPPCAAAGCDDGPGPSDRRGADEFVAVSWDELTELLADELRRVVDTHGNEAIYGGSYGWASAGRFHHAQSQVHRFLKLLGGYTFSRHSYSLGATGVIMPRVVGTHDDLFKRSTAVGGHRRAHRSAGVLRRVGAEEHRRQSRWHHRTSGPRRRCAGSATGAAASCRSRPLRDDVDGDCEWHAPVPGTDVAIMLALAHVLATEGLADRDFLDTYCTGYERFERYLLGTDDGVAEVAGSGREPSAGWPPTT